MKTCHLFPVISLLFLFTSFSVLAAESCNVEDLSAVPNGKELEPLLEGVPGANVSSDCVQFINVPADTFVAPYRRETLRINDTTDTTSVIPVTEGMTVAIQGQVLAEAGGSQILRFELHSYDQNSAEQTVYYRWRVLTENPLGNASCPSIHANEQLNVPYAVEMENTEATASICLSASQDGYLVFNESGIEISINGANKESPPMFVQAGDTLTLWQVEDKNSRTFAYNGGFESNDGTLTNIEWITVNDINISSHSGADDSPIQDPEPEVFPLTADPDLFSSCREVALYIRENGKRSQRGTMLATSLELPPGEAATSECIELAELEAPVSVSNRANAWFAVNGGEFEQGEVELTNGDRLVLGFVASSEYGVSQTQRLNMVPTAQATNQDTFYIKWDVQTANTARAPIQWHVEPGTQYEQIEDIAEQLVAGDVVNVIGDNVYEPFILEGISGTRALPIRIVGKSVNGKRPIFSGSHSRWPWTIGVRSSHSFHFENIEITGADTICFRHEADDITLKNVYLHDCIVHGILGTDALSGSLTITESEITSAGGKHEDRPWGHAIYVATDQFRFPHSVLTISHSFLHNNKGNTIKSRAERLALYYNWIEVNDLEQAKFAVELIGPVVDTRHPIEQDVTGNLFWLDKDFYAIRAGSDGTGGSKGIVRFTNNTIIHASETDAYSFMRLDHEMTAVGLQNNLFVKKNPQATYTLIRDNVTEERWTYGEATIYINNNVLPLAPYINSTNIETRRALIEDYLPHDRYFDNLADNTIDPVTVDYSDKRITADTTHAVFQLGTAAEAFNGEIQFDNPLRYLDVSYKAPNNRPEEQAPILKVHKDCDATIGAF
ncbi:hypothetical protein [Alteromonas sp. C1M14]|uniref:hypothetical protein n=1 Tax=Alteromonas sp. C1M14 TaxID=2841567 RepID=UPI001C0A48A2|nr:hypothetical protein [Alteromonas sp. C1M14]MBU2979207.1 hypothetical protein [Alteromonas sp. C1M14]